MKNKLKDWHQDIKSQSSVMATSHKMKKVLVLGGGGFHRKKYYRVPCQTR